MDRGDSHNATPEATGLLTTAKGSGPHSGVPEAADSSAVVTGSSAVGQSGTVPGGFSATDSLGILGSIADLPKAKALGVELRATAALAAPVSMLDGSFLEVPLRVRHELGGDLATRRDAVSRTLRQLVQHFEWKGAVGCSVTKEVSRLLDVDSDDFATIEAGAGAVVSKLLRGRASFCHTVVHTDAAGYNELVWGDNADETRWRGQVVLVCTLGKHLGAVIFNNGRRVRNSPLPLKTIEPLPGHADDDKFEPPEVGSQDFDLWAERVDAKLSELVAAVSTLDRVIALPTGRTARSTELSGALLPKLSSTLALARAKGCEVAVPVQREGSVVRGVALCTLVELQAVELSRSLESVVNGIEALHSLSESQLQLIFQKLDTNCNGRVEVRELQEGLEVLGVHRDMDTLIREVGTTRDGAVSFDRFMRWWDQEFRTARVVRITSANAWRRLIASQPPSGYTDLILLEVTFTFCRSCHRFEPKMRRLAEQYPMVHFVQLVGNATIGAMELSTKELRVRVSPAFFVFRRGKLLTRWEGSDVERFQANLTECCGG